MALYLAVDVGGTNIKYAVMNEEAEIKEKGEYPTPMEGGLEGFLDSLKQIYEQYGTSCEALVMSAPGRIDADAGYFYTSGALRYIDGVNLKERLKEIIPLPFAVENDAKAAALAELWKGSMKGVNNGVVLTLGTGIGGALIIDGKLYRGSTFAAGEVSGVPTDLHSFPYDLHGMWAMMNSVGILSASYAAKKGIDPKECNGRILFEAANQGEQTALDVIDEYCRHLSAGILNLQFILDVEKVSIGGGISKQPLLLQSLQKQIQLYYEEASHCLPASLPEITSCTFGNDANMIGALYHYLYEIKHA